MPTIPIYPESPPAVLPDSVLDYARALGFYRLYSVPVDLSGSRAYLQEWLAQEFNGDMAFMAHHDRCVVDTVLPGAKTALVALLPYLPSSATPSDEAVAPNIYAKSWQTLSTPGQAYISLYARGNDYHRVARKKLKLLIAALHRAYPQQKFISRAIADSAPLLEVELAKRGGVGWRGKNTLLLRRDSGSFYFLSEIVTTLALPTVQHSESTAACGSCRRCVDICPTQAIVAPYRLDARRCISYLTIEHKGAIPLELRPLMGNRIYGCDDCQLICPWNKWAVTTSLADFSTRDIWQEPYLLNLWQWDEKTFLANTLASPIRRIGYERWQRNIAVALGNAARNPACNSTPNARDKKLHQDIKQALAGKLPAASPLVAEHIQWALMQTM